MARADADAEARRIAAKLANEADGWMAHPATFPLNDSPKLGHWIGQATATLRQLSMEPEPDDPPEYDPDDAEAQRIAEVFADARAEQDRGL